MKRRILAIVFWGVQALALLVVAQLVYEHWMDEADFRAQSPGEHYRRALALGRLDPYSGHSTDLDLAIRHLEAIPKDAQI